MEDASRLRAAGPRVTLVRPAILPAACGGAHAGWLMCPTPAKAVPGGEWSMCIVSPVCRRGSGA
jgi:hypothetical protein